MQGRAGRSREAFGKTGEMKRSDVAEKVIENLYLNNIKIKKSERVLIYTDKSETRHNLFNTAILFSDIAKNFSHHVTFSFYPPLAGHGCEPPENIWIEAFGKAVVDSLKDKGLFKKLLTKELSKDKLNAVKKIIRDFKESCVDVVIALSFFSTSHTQFRQLLTNVAGTRFCSMPLFEDSMFYSSLQEDWTILKKRTIFLKEKLRKASHVIVKSENGTYLTFSVADREFFTDTGELSFPGSFSNIPAGEVFTAPREGSANGKLIIEYSPIAKLDSPLTLWIEDGTVVHVEGADAYKNILNEKFKLSKYNRNIAEFGIGTNSKAHNMLNILESEKILGTIHIALGDNSSFGGKVKTNFHEDYIVNKPTVEIYTEDKNNFFILYNGKPLF